MTLAHVQVVWMIGVSIISVVWFIGLWRGQSDDLARDIPKLEDRVAILEGFMHETRAALTMIVEIRSRLETVAKRMHDQNDKLAGLPEALSGVFMRKEIAAVSIQESVDDRRRIHQRLDQLASDLLALRTYIDTRRQDRSAS